MARTYKRLSIKEREIIFKGLSSGKPQKYIAKELNRAPSVISREIHRLGFNKHTYLPSQAQNNADYLKSKQRKRHKINSNTRLKWTITTRLREGWSPKQIDKYQKKQGGLRISYESIYKYIYSIENKKERSLLISFLRQKRRLRRNRKNVNKRRSSIKDIVSIHDRDKNADSRLIPGHWEGDFIVGKNHKSAIMTLVERATRMTYILSFDGIRNSITVGRAIASFFSTLPKHLKRSLTFDRDVTMSGHKKITELTGVRIFFADAYSPWQRGSNENINGLIREYLIKGTDFNTVSDKELQIIQSKLNSRPKEVIGYNFPKDAFQFFQNNPNCDMNDFYQIA